MTKIDLCANPSLDFLLANGKQDSDDTNNSSFLWGINKKTYLNYKFGDNNCQQEIGLISNFGSNPNPAEFFNNNKYMKNPYNDTVIRPDGNDLTLTNIQKFTYTCFYQSLLNCNKNIDNSVCNDPNTENNSPNFKLEVGINQNMQKDSSGYMTGGWFKYDHSKYLGGGFETFSNSYIWNPTSAGVYLELQLSSKINAFACYNTPQTVASRGFISNDSPSLITSGIIYQNKLCNIKQCLSLAVQRIDEGSNDDTENNLNWTVPNTAKSSNDDTSLSDTRSSAVAITNKARSSLQDRIANNNKTTAYTGILSLNTEKAGANLSYTFAEYDQDEVDSVNKNRLIKSSIGAFVRFNNFLSRKSCQNQYGINVGTPTFLSNGESRPTIIELSCLFSFSQFNIPLYFDYIIDQNSESSSADDDNGDDGDNADNVGNDKNYDNAFVFGMTPNIIINAEINNNSIEMKQKNILECNYPEGGIEEIIIADDNTEDKSLNNGINSNNIEDFLDEGF